jgi:hypothetical protein
MAACGRALTNNCSRAWRNATRRIKFQKHPPAGRRKVERGGNQAAANREKRRVKVMPEVVGKIIGIVLVLVAISIALKVLFFLLGMVGLLFGLGGVLLKLAVFGGVIYLAWLLLRKLFAEKQAI